MPAQMLFVNRAPNAERLKLLLIKPSDHQWGKNECMASWVLDGNTPETWSYAFTLVKVLDKTPEELKALVAGKSFIEPFKGVGKLGDLDYQPAHPDYTELATTGEMTRTYAQIEQYIYG